MALGGTHSVHAFKGEVGRERFDPAVNFFIPLLTICNNRKVEAALPFLGKTHAPMEGPRRLNKRRGKRSTGRRGRSRPILVSSRAALVAAVPRHDAGFSAPALDGFGDGCRRPSRDWSRAGRPDAHAPARSRGPTSTGMGRRRTELQRANGRSGAVLAPDSCYQWDRRQNLSRNNLPRTARADVKRDRATPDRASTGGRDIQRSFGA